MKGSKVIKVEKEQGADRFTVQLCTLKGYAEGNTIGWSVLMAYPHFPHASLTHSRPDPELVSSVAKLIYTN